VRSCATRVPVNSAPALAPYAAILTIVPRFAGRPSGATSLPKIWPKSRNIATGMPMVKIVNCGLRMIRLISMLR